MGGLVDLLVRFLRRFERRGNAVHAIAHSGRCRAVGKDVAEMPATSTAVHLDAGHHHAAIGRRGHGAFDRRRKARPAGAALELRLGGKKRLSAAGTMKSALPLLPVELARTGPLGAVLAEDVKLL